MQNRSDVAVAVARAEEYADIMALDYVSNYTRNKEIHFFALFYFLLCYTKARRVGGSG